MGIVAAVSVAVAAYLALTTDPVDPTTGLPIVVRFVHGYGREDLLGVDSDGVVTGWLGGLDGYPAVGCLADASFVRDIGGAAVVDLEPGATEPHRDGYDIDRLEVTGSRGTAWLGDGGNEVVRLAKLLVAEVHRPEADRTFCRVTAATTPGELAGGAVLRRWSGPTWFEDAVLVSATGAVTGRTRDAVISCEVPETTAREVTTAAVPQVVPPEEGGDVVQLSIGRGEVDHPLDPTGGDALTTAALAVLDDIQLPPAQRTLCTSRS